MSRGVCPCGGQTTAVKLTGDDWLYQCGGCGRAEVVTKPMAEWARAGPKRKRIISGAQGGKGPKPINTIGERQ